MLFVYGFFYDFKYVILLGFAKRQNANSRVETVSWRPTQLKLCPTASEPKVRNLYRTMWFQYILTNLKALHGLTSA